MGGTNKSQSPSIMFLVFVAHVTSPNDTLRGTSSVDEDVDENVIVVNAGLSGSLLLGLDSLSTVYACCWDIILNIVKMYGKWNGKFKFYHLFLSLHIFCLFCTCGGRMRIEVGGMDGARRMYRHDGKDNICFRGL